jgi:hypothetical protein
VLALAAAALLVTAGVAVGLGSGGDGNGDPTAVKHPGHKAAGQKPHRENPVAQRRTAQSIDRESTGGQRPGGQQPDRAKALGQKPSGGTPPGGNPLPDLTVESLKADVQPRPGCRSEDCFVTMVNFTIRNAGAAEVAVSFQVLIRVDGIEKRITVRGLAGDASVPLSEELAAGANCFKADCTVQVTVDSGDAVAESNETNNTGGADLQRWPLTGRSVSISVMRSPLAPE